jgi:hypothetical protein
MFRNEYMGELGGKSFFQCNSDWDRKPIMGLLSTHARDMYGKTVPLNYVPLNDKLVVS